MWETNMTKPKQMLFFPWVPKFTIFVSTKIYIYSNFEEKKPLKIYFSKLCYLGVGP